MDLKKLFTEERAVSPVIGVILMVAITVILAAVIGAFVLGLGGETQETPQASLSFELNETNGETNVDVEHRGGDSFNLTNVEIAGDLDDAQFNDAEQVLSNGNTVIIEEDTEANGDFDPSPGDRVRLIWTPSGNTLASTTL